LQKAENREKEAETSGLAFKSVKDEKVPEPVAEAEKAAETAQAVSETGSDEEDFDLEALLAELDAEDDDTSQEAEETSKAKKMLSKKKNPFAKKKVEEPAPDENAEDGEDGEDDWQDDDEDDEEKEAREIPTFLGDIPTDHFATLMAEALSTALEPYFMQLKEIGERVKEIQSSGASTKEAQTSALAETTKAVEAQADELGKLRKAAETQAKILAATQKRLKELEEGVSPAAKGYIASQDDETVVKEGAPILTQVPRSDPLADFTNFVIGQSGQPV